MAQENREAMKENRDPNTPRKKEIPEGEDVLEIGSTVELVGLKTAQAYNGQQAEAGPSEETFWKEIVCGMAAQTRGLFLC